MGHPLGTVLGFVEDAGDHLAIMPLLILVCKQHAGRVQLRSCCNCNPSLYCFFVENTSGCSARLPLPITFCKGGQIAVCLRDLMRQCWPVDVFCPAGARFSLQSAGLEGGCNAGGKADWHFH